MKDIFEMPDGSAFFMASVGPRDPGFVNWLKYHREGYARRYLFVWRMFWSSMEISRLPGQGPPMSPWRALRYALSCP